MTLQRLAYFAMLAKASPRDAARGFLTEATEGVVLQLMEAADWSDDDVVQFEATAQAIPIMGPWGMFWLASPRCTRVLAPPAPRLAPSGIKALAGGLVEELLEESPLPTRGVA